MLLSSFVLPHLVTMLTTILAERHRECYRIMWCLVFLKVRAMVAAQTWQQVVATACLRRQTHIFRGGHGASHVFSPQAAGSSLCWFGVQFLDMGGWAVLAAIIMNRNVTGQQMHCFDIAQTYALYFGPRHCVGRACLSNAGPYQM